MEPGKLATGRLYKKNIVIILTVFCITLGLMHWLFSMAIQTIAYYSATIPGFTGNILNASLNPKISPRVVVIGSSISGARGAVTLASQLGNYLQWGNGLVLNMSHDGRNLADQLAELIIAERYGIDVAVVEVNPRTFNSRICPGGGPSREHMIVTTESEKGGTVFPYVRNSVRFQIIRQLGVEGVLDLIARKFAPGRLRHVASDNNDEKDSSVVGGVFGALRGVILKPKEKPFKYPDKLPEYAFNDMCKNYILKKVNGVDMEVFEDMLKWSRKSRIKVIFFIPPLNQSLTQRCGAVTSANLNRLIMEILARARSAGITILDYSNVLNGHEELFYDYAHYQTGKGETAFSIWIPMLADKVREFSHKNHM